MNAAFALLALLPLGALAAPVDGNALAVRAKAADPCALRALLATPARDIALLVAQAVDTRGRACLMVVHANALAREGHGSEAAQNFDAAMDALPEITNALELAKRRSTSTPAPPAPEVAPTSHEEAARFVMQLLREAKPKRAVQVALACHERCAAAQQDAPHEALELATLTALVRAERTDEAIARFARLPHTDASLKARGWVLGKANRHREARDLYAQLAVTTADKTLAAEAAFLAAFTAYDSGDLEDAHTRFATSLPMLAGTPLLASARWYLALCDLLRGRWSQALPVLELLVREMPDEREALKHRYWLARARFATTDKASKVLARDELSALTDSQPIEYYGLLARARLGRKPLQGAKVGADALAQLARDDEDAGKVLLLWQLGLDEEARMFARALGEASADIGLQHKIGDATFGWRRGARFMPFPRTRGGALVRDAGWRVSFASPWRDVVDASANKYGVPASFIYAIMRTESGFDPRAVSVAGAQGLLQLLPSAARGSAGLAGRPLEDARRIFEPEVAIDLGTALLAAGRREFGSLALSAAAYNGGARNVAGWLAQKQDLEVELFIESIPFKETRDYVKRVLAAEATYRALDGGALFLDLPTSLPAPPSTFTHFVMDE